jgi:hypothetical protein
MTVRGAFRQTCKAWLLPAFSDPCPKPPLARRRPTTGWLPEGRFRPALNFLYVACDVVGPVFGDSRASPIKNRPLGRMASGGATCALALDGKAQKQAQQRA